VGKLTSIFRPQSPFETQQRIRNLQHISEASMMDIGIMSSPHLVQFAL